MHPKENPAGLLLGQIPQPPGGNQKCSWAGLIRPQGHDTAVLACGFAIDQKKTQR
jgi:hypothetical protein